MFEMLKGRQVHLIDEDEYKKFAVMVILVAKDGEPHVLFEKRAGSLRRQPGEICFPGGARDPGETALENAVREAAEELEIHRDQLHVIAQMDTMLTPYANEVAVFLAEARDYQMTWSAAEVDEVFLVPLAFFMENDPAVYRNTVQLIQPEDFPFDLVPGGRDYHWRQGRQKVYFYEYEDKVIWGLTAYIMQSVINIIKTEGCGQQ